MNSETASNQPAGTSAPPTSEPTSDAGLETHPKHGKPDEIQED
jgi:hypothetical protein